MPEQAHDTQNTAEARRIPRLPRAQRGARWTPPFTPAWAASEDLGLVVEIDGGHDALASSPVDDALRQKAVVLRGEPLLRIPVIGLRLMPDALMAQVAAGHRLLRAT